MDEDKATFGGMIVGGVLGFTAAAAGTLAAPVIAPIVGAYIVMAAMIGGAAAGGTAAMKIAEKVNEEHT